MKVHYNTSMNVHYDTCIKIVSFNNNYLLRSYCADETGINITGDQPTEYHIHNLYSTSQPYVCVSRNNGFLHYFLQRDDEDNSTNIPMAPKAICLFIFFFFTEKINFHKVTNQNHCSPSQSLMPGVLHKSCRLCGMSTPKLT